MNIGLDFGTTNSILSFYNKNGDYIDTYKLDGNAGENYIPSVVAFDDGDIFIGESAKNLIDDEYAKVYSRYKILLNLNDRDRLIAHGYDDRTPHEITEIYLRELINKFKSDYRLKKIDSLVITIPEIWLRDDYISRSVLKNIVTKLKLPLKKFVSEPVSAGAYFLYNYEKDMGKRFNGHILVFDYGGGTLDISLLRTQNNRIKVLERTGMGKGDLFSGSAGVAFDERVIRTMCEKNVSKLGQKYYGLLNEFERKKIQSSSKHEKFILEYMQDRSKNRRVFKLTCEDKHDNILGIFNITASNLVNAFKDLDRDIKNTLQEMSSKFLKYGVDVTNADKFRVVMVGGFSNFYLSKRSVKEFFGADDEDKRFETHFRADDIALAISKGASLIAEDIINIDETYPISVGLIVKIMNSKGFVEEHYISIFKQGDSVQTYEVSYIDKRISQAGKLIFAFDNEDKKSSFKIKIDKDVHELYPNFNRINNKWQIGFSIDSSNFIYVHVRDKYGYEKKTELGDILNEYSEAVIMVD
jgi:molecular chaperone DnaK